MPRMSRVQEHARQHIVSLSRQSLLPDDLTARILQILREALPSDMHMMFGVDSPSLLFNRLFGAGSEPGGGAAEWLRSRYAFEPELPDASSDYLHARAWLEHVYLHGEGSFIDITFPTLMRTGLHVVALRDRPEECWGVPEQLVKEPRASDFQRAYHEGMNPPGGGLRACFSIDGQWVAAYQLARLDPAVEVRLADLAFIRQVSPLIAQAIRSAVSRELATVQFGEKPDAPGVLVLTRSGKLLYSTSSGERIVNRLRESRLPGPPGRVQLPTGVWTAVAQLKAAGEEQAIQSVRVDSAFGPVRIDASWTRDGEAIVVVLTPETPPAPPILPSDWPLTGQERRVLTLVVRGLGNEQIAAELVVSRHTVESHLAHAYEKLGVHSRTQLLGLLFRTTNLPGIRASTAQGMSISPSS